MAFDLEELKARAAGKIARFCPLLGEWCTAGWTPKMGYNDPPTGAPSDAKTPKYGACASWQPLRLFDAPKNEVVPLRVCAQFDQVAGLLAEIDKEIAQGAASTDKVATEVRSQHLTIVAGSSDEVKARLASSRPAFRQIPAFKDALQLEIKPAENGHGA